MANLAHLLHVCLSVARDAAVYIWYVSIVSHSLTLWPLLFPHMQRIADYAKGRNLEGSVTSTGTDQKASSSSKHYTFDF